MNLTDLKKPFAASDIEWRIQQSGKNDNGIWARCLAYVTNRAIMDRLDSVCGPENWENEFLPAPDGGVACRLRIKCGDTWVRKEDGASNTDIEAVKGGLSSTMKRTAVQWGIGRYLYNLEPGWAKISENGRFSAKTKDGTWFKWDPPTLPDWALPEQPNVPALPKDTGNAQKNYQALLDCLVLIDTNEQMDAFVKNNKESFSKLMDEETMEFFKAEVKDRRNKIK